jgi:hypothetical protein
MTPKEILIEAQNLCKEFGWDPEHGGVVPQIALLYMMEELIQIVSSRGIPLETLEKIRADYLSE